jgi:hypothetical protein
MTSLNRFKQPMLLFFFALFGFTLRLYSGETIPANHPSIQYFGRWDMTDPTHPRHSWPGVYIYVGFTGKSIGIRLTDNVNYYNVYIDGKFRSVFHGDMPGEADYTLAAGLEDGNHSLLFSKRNISFDEVINSTGLFAKSD